MSAVEERPDLEMGAGQDVVDDRRLAAAEVFRFNVLTPVERRKANERSGLIRVFGDDEDGWPTDLGWRTPPAESVRTGRDWFWQREVLDEWLLILRWIGLKARQLGITWLACALTAWLALYKPGSRSLHFRQKQDDVIDNVRMAWALMQSLPRHLWNGASVKTPDIARAVEPTTTIELTFRNREISRVQGMTSASESGHGKRAALIVLDEFSRIEGAATIMKAVNSAAGQTGRILIISTANGVSNPETGEGNRFHWAWVNADTQGWRKRFLPWSLHPERDERWYKTDPELATLMAHERAEQYPANEDEAFALTTNNFFDPEDFSHYTDLVPETLGRFEFQKVSSRQAKLTKRSDGMLRLYEWPQEDVKYAIGCDPSTGLRLDYSAVCVVNLSTMAICAELYARVDLDLLAYQLHYLGKWFNRALIAVETTGGYGHAVITPLRDGREGRPPYGNLYKHRQWSTPSLDEHKGFGWPTNSNTRPRLTGLLGKVVREHALPYMPRVLMDEAKTFLRAPLPGQSQAGTWPRAQEGTHDDMIFATAIALEMYRERGEHPERKPRKAKAQRLYKPIGRRRRDTIDLERYPGG